jgi:hypothetical protein
MHVSGTLAPDLSSNIPTAVRSGQRSRSEVYFRPLAKLHNLILYAFDVNSTFYISKTPRSYNV